ncbi:dehydrogenase [Chitinophaga caeni]|uniref:Dehydrogenase n=1 Tax=Chitinophaga caeni TaxID=2029983 RepID=A0A291QYK1_9BACT|nr:c-type cytochrome [Chitinophaga caeni]ATL49025.1 dehydrogenase [Chitinophaga caeni]
MMKLKIAPVWIFSAFAIAACQPGQKNPEQDSLEARKEFAQSPVYKTGEALKTLQLDPSLSEKLEISLAASEPTVFVPVAATEDEKGRLWLVEMTGYMPDINGDGEEMKNGKLVILEDTDHNGSYDSRKVFMDSLVLPRAVCLVNGGVLIAEPPNLWFVENLNDHPGKKTLVDPNFADGGNVEHQPNGLLRGLDNWIYNAKSDKRYRYKDGKWLIETTRFRGQWGITEDAFGRLFYNTNSDNVLGDYFPASLGNHPVYQSNVAGYNERIVADNSVYPSRATPGVNRGYQDGILDDKLRLVNLTAACGPYLYRDNRLGDSLFGNVFVAEPAANVVKRNLVQYDGFVVNGQQAHKGVEFIASTDERFRPVNIMSTYDGSLLILDMYRGVIQHKTYLTDYLKKEIKSRDLETPLNCGRIYRVTGKKWRFEPPSFPYDNIQLLCKWLSSGNNWEQVHAQQWIVDHQLKKAAPVIVEYLKNAELQENTKLRLLYTLEGLGVLTWENVTSAHLQTLLGKMQIIAMSTNLYSTHSKLAIRDSINRWITYPDLAPAVALSIYEFKKKDPGFANGLVQYALQHYPRDKFVVDGLIASMYQDEIAFQQVVNREVKDTSLLIHRRLQQVIDEKIVQEDESKLAALRKQFPAGYKIYDTYCKTCHGNNGEGVKSLAPPLNGSEWVNGNKEHLIRIVLFGLTGPVHVAGKTYESPEINGDMPGIGNSDEFSDKDIASLLSFIRQSWKNNAPEIQLVDIKAVRAAEAGRDKAFTSAELK